MWYIAVISLFVVTITHGHGKIARGRYSFIYTDDDIKNIDSAKQACLKFGSKLAPIGSEPEYTDMNVLCQHAKTVFNKPCIIDAHYDENSKQFVDSDEKKETYKQGWFAGFPTQNVSNACVVQHIANKTAHGFQNVACNSAAGFVAVCEGTQQQIINPKNNFGIVIGMGRAWKLDQGDSACSENFGKYSKMIKLKTPKGVLASQINSNITELSSEDTSSGFKLYSEWMSKYIMPELTKFAMHVNMQTDLNLIHPETNLSMVNDHVAYYSSDKDLTNEYFGNVVCTFELSENKGCKGPTHEECAKLLENEPTGWGWPIVCIIFGSLIVGFVFFKKFMATREERKARKAAGKAWGDSQWSKVDGDEPWEN